MNSGVEKTTEESAEVNKFARRNRHLKVFSKSTLVKIHFVDLIKWFLKPIFWLLKTKPFRFVFKTIRSFKHLFDSLVPDAPQRKLIFDASLLAIAVLVVSSFNPGVALTTIDLSYADEYISSYELPGDIIVADDSGYLVKINPQTDVASRIGVTDFAYHTVQSGEVLSVISERYGVKVDTILWENKLANANAIRVGQKLSIPPVNGISYSAASSDTLEKIAKKYDIEVETIIAQNGLSSDIVVKGQDLFLPGAKPIRPIIASTYRPATSSYTYISANPSTAAPNTGRPFIYPTKGSITQGYRAGHYAIDIADTSRPPVWAAAAGTITKASTGTWGGGYGNHVVIDHGNGLTTLYAHLDSVNVYVGQSVAQGAVIGIMGNTGRVYGRTGIHLHWEVNDNGYKANPYNYY